MDTSKNIKTSSLRGTKQSHNQCFVLWDCFTSFAMTVVFRDAQILIWLGFIIANKFNKNYNFTNLKHIYKPYQSIKFAFTFACQRCGMVYPGSFENKTGFDKIRAKLRQACLSPLGQQWVDGISFKTDFETLKHLLALTGEMKVICQIEDTFPTNHYFDSTNLLKKLRIEGTFPEPEELFDLQRSLDTIRFIHSFFKEKGNKYPNLQSLAINITLYSFVSERINSILNKQGKVKDNASSELSTIRRQINSKGQDISKRMQQFLQQAREAGWADSDASLSVREGRLVIPMQATHKRSIKGIVHDESASGKTVFLEPADVVEMNNELRELEFAERRELIRILTAFANEIRPYLDDLLNAHYFLGEIDFIRSKALLAIEIDGISPPLNDKPLLDWHKAMHPLLNLHLRSEGKNIVPLDIKLNEKQRILVISGPNAGGKSVCLQTAGLLQYMLQCGIPVPMKETSEAGIFEHIFIDIGDEQSIENDLSTYSSHLQHMKFFVKKANASTLFLIDEFGAGTEPILGGAIAEAILESLNQQLSFGIITTHYTNLKHIASSTEGIINGAMLYDMQHLKPLFKMETGEPGSSFAFEIARNIGLPENILQSAISKAGEKTVDFDKALKEVIRDKHYWRQRREHIKESGKKLDSMLERYSGELDEISKLRKEIIKKAKAEAEELLGNANKQIENTIREIKESGAEKERTRQVRKKLEEFKNDVKQVDTKEEEFISRKINQLKQREERKSQRLPLTEKKEEKKIAPDLTTIITGDKVKLFGQDTVGEVLGVNGKSILVAFGQMTTTLHENRLEKISNSEYKKIQKNLPQTNQVENQQISERKLQFKPSIDIRGLRADEALQKVAEFIDDAIMVDVPDVKILHGKGNGILRQLIRDYLKTIDFIESFADENIQFGGAGITVVKFIR